MIKLSRSGWNNIIIFSVMAFILLINLTQKNSFENLKNEPKSDLIIGEYNIILSLTVNQHTYIERIGQSWRATPSVISGQLLESMMSAWHETRAQTVEQPDNIDKSKGIIVSVELAGKSDSEYFILLPNPDSLLIFRQSTKQWFILPSPFFSQLLPPQVIL